MHVKFFMSISRTSEVAGKASEVVDFRKSFNMRLEKTVECGFNKICCGNK